jgi:hypothetical protein
VTVSNLQDRIKKGNTSISIQKLILQSQTPRIFKELILLSAVANKLPNLSEIKWLAILAAQGESVWPWFY